MWLAHECLHDSKTSMYYVCTNCQSFYDQPLGRVVEKVSESSGNVNMLFKTHAGPTVADHCPECNSILHVSFLSKDLLPDV